MEFEDLLETTDIRNNYVDYSLLTYLFEEKWLYLASLGFGAYHVKSPTTIHRNHNISEKCAMRFITNLVTHANRIDGQMPQAYHIGPFTDSFLYDIVDRKLPLEVDGWSKVNPAWDLIDLIADRISVMSAKLIIVEWNPTNFKGRDNQIHNEFIHFMKDSLDRPSDNIMIVIENER